MIIPLRFAVILALLGLAVSLTFTHCRIIPINADDVLDSTFSDVPRASAAAIARLRNLVPPSAQESYVRAPLPKRFSDPNLPDPNYRLKNLKGPSPGQKPTALDDYLADTAPFYDYTLISSWQAEGYFVAQFNMTSTIWFNSSLVSCYNWWHFLTVVVPDFLNPDIFDNAIMLIDGGHRTAGAPNEGSSDIEIFGLVAQELGLVTAMVKGIPNMPCEFSNDPQHIQRVEDQIIAFGWQEYLIYQDEPQWLVRLPMVKAALLALDTIQSYMNSSFGVAVNNFVTLGASKRGWTTWLTGAVDTRLVGIAPIVMDDLNFLPNIAHHYMAYCGWSFAVEDYWQQNFTENLGRPIVQTIFNAEDPFVYRSRMMSLPKLINSAGNDEFFLPDDSRWWMKYMGGLQYQRIYPDCEHELIACFPNIIESIEAFAVSIFYGDDIPQFQWNIDNSTGIITAIQVGGKQADADAVLLSVTSVSSERRDFRWAAIDPHTGQPAFQPNFYSRSNITRAADGTWTAPCSAPDKGWTACFLAISTPARLGFSHVFTTDVSIQPQTFPCQPCEGPQQCRGKLV